MKQARRPQNHFATALREARKALGVTQEGFDVISSRTYVSSLERGLKGPTLNKVDELADVLGIHPLTLLTLAYLDEVNQKTLALALRTVEGEIKAILKLQS